MPPEAKHNPFPMAIQEAGILERLELLQYPSGATWFFFWKAVASRGITSTHAAQKPRRTYRWSKEARELVRTYLKIHQAVEGPPPPDLCNLRDLVTKLLKLTGYPREVCLAFARRLGVTERQSYREWSKAEEQKLLDLIALHPPAEIAKIMHRPAGSIRGKLYLLGAHAQMGREWFTVYTLAAALHIGSREVQRWIAQGWLKSREVETGSLRKHIIDADDFAEFCKKHRREIIGRRLNADRLDFVQRFVFPPSHVELLPARAQGYKTRRKLSAISKEGDGEVEQSSQVQFKVQADLDTNETFEDGSMADTA